VNRFLRRNGGAIIDAARRAGITPKHAHVMNDGVNSSREQNPFTFCQILELYLFLLSSRMGFRESRIERGQSEWRGRDLRVLRGCRDQS